jgi:predicted Rdx family selenoprotein
MKPNDPMEFYQALARSMRQKAAARDGIPVMLRCGGAAEHESERMQKIFSALGITTIDPESGGKFKVENNQVYLIEKDETGNRVKRKVGYIFIGEDLTWADRSFKPSMQKYIQDLALLFLEPGEGQKDAQDTVRNLLADINERSGLPDLNKIRRILVEQGFMDPNEKYLVPGLIEAALKGRVGLNNSAGTDFINDKEIYLYVEKFIRYYLRERPLLKNVPSRPFAKPNGELDPQVLDDVFDHIDQHVIKRFDGRGGSSVWIGGKLKPKERRELKAQIEQMPEFFKDQTKLVLSQMGDQIGDIRILAHVDSERVITANTGWGRNSPANGSGKVNLSAKGVEVAVLVNKRCKDRLH